MDDPSQEAPPQNEDPEFIRAAFSSVLDVVQTYGWIILFVLCLLFYVWNKMKPQMMLLKQQKDEENYKKMDTGLAHSRMEAMERARQKMQEQLDGQAQEFMEKQKLREEEKRQKKIEDWQRQQEGKSQLRTTKAPDKKNPLPSSQDKERPKKKLKPEYNPLMGDMGGACYRPTRRGGASGGG